MRKYTEKEKIDLIENRIDFLLESVINFNSLDFNSLGRLLDSQGQYIKSPIEFKVKNNNGNDSCLVSINREGGISWQ